MAEFEADTTEIFTRQMTEGEAQFEMEQFDDAMDLLNGSKEDGRIEGVEQLGSLTGEESEMMLAKLLITDINPDLRNSAAQSLETFELPLDSTITDLVSALEDESEDVRFLVYDLTGNNSRFENYSYRCGWVKIPANTDNQTF
jgi:hypothetical protein